MKLLYIDHSVYKACETILAGPLAVGGMKNTTTPIYTSNYARTGGGEILSVASRARARALLSLTIDNIYTVAVARRAIEQSEKHHRRLQQILLRRDGDGRTDGHLLLFSNLPPSTIFVHYLISQTVFAVGPRRL